MESSKVSVSTCWSKSAQKTGRGSIMTRTLRRSHTSSTNISYGGTSHGNGHSTPGRTMTIYGLQPYVPGSISNWQVSMHPTAQYTSSANTSKSSFPDVNPVCNLCVCLSQLKRLLNKYPRSQALPMRLHSDHPESPLKASEWSEYERTNKAWERGY